MDNVDQYEIVQVTKLQAETYGTLAVVFNQRPSSELVSNMKAMGLEIFRQFKEGGNLNSEVLEGLTEISNFITQIKEQSETTIEQSLQVDWTRLFRGLKPGYGPKPPYEGVYLGESENDLKVLESVAQYYAKHGVAPARDAGNRPDYIGLELDFLRLLCEQQIEAWEKGDQIQAQKLQSAEQDFLRHHLGKWAAIYCDRAIEEAKTDFYRGFARLAKGLIEEKLNTKNCVAINN